MEVDLETQNYPEKGPRTPKSPRIPYKTTEDGDYLPTKDLPPGEARMKRPGRDFLRHESIKFDFDNMKAERDLSPTPGRSLYTVEFPVRDQDDQTDYRSTVSSSRPLVGDTLDRSTLSSRYDPGQQHADLNQSIMSVRERLELKKAIRERNELNRSLHSANSPHSPHSLPPHSPYSPAEFGLNRSVLSNHGDLNRSTASRPDLYENNVNHSILSTVSKVPSHHQNGFIKPLDENKLSQSRKSLNFSGGSLNNTRVTLYGSKDFGVRNSLVSLGLVCILSLVLAVIGIQLLFRLNTRQMTQVTTRSLSNSLLHNNESYASTLEVAVALTTFVIMFDLVCLLVCSFQLYFAAKLVKCPQGDERTFKYLKECASTRFIAIAAFFVSIPILLLAILLYAILEFHATASIISTVILSGGVSYAIATVVHSGYVWRTEKEKADLNIPPFEKKHAPENLQALNQSELSTLV